VQHYLTSEQKPLEDAGGYSWTPTLSTSSKAATTTVKRLKVSGKKGKAVLPPRMQNKIESSSD
jgi:hypothetical protein